MEESEIPQWRERIESFGLMPVLTNAFLAELEETPFRRTLNATDPPQVVANQVINYSNRTVNDLSHSSCHFFSEIRSFRNQTVAKISFLCEILQARCTKRIDWDPSYTEYHITTVFDGTDITTQCEDQDEFAKVPESNFGRALFQQCSAQDNPLNALLDPGGAGKPKKNKKRSK